MPRPFKPGFLITLLDAFCASTSAAAPATHGPNPGRRADDSQSNPEGNPMKNTRPVNLMTPEQSRAGGWQAESRDGDGHLITQHSPFEDAETIAQYVREETGRGLTVTIWPMPNNHRKAATPAQMKPTVRLDGLDLLTPGGTMVSMSEYERRVEELAVRFASDYGPLLAAREGNSKARSIMRERLTEMAVDCGLLIEPQ